MVSHTADCIILGAGLAGITAARYLNGKGQRTLVVDKGRGIGGRLATRRIGEARLDHGAQFFTTRGEAFVELVNQAVAADVVHEWCRGYGEPDGYPRYCGRDGMTGFAKWLAADLDVVLATEVDAIAATSADGVMFLDDDGSVVASAPTAIVTAPIPQMLRLFERGAVTIEAELDAALRASRYFATLALLVVIEGQPSVEEPGGMQLSDGPFTFIAENQRKGISAAPALTFHAEHDYSARRFDDDPEDVHAELLAMAAPWIGDATVIESQLKKWRYAGPVTPLPEPTYVIDASGSPIALAGDAFAGPKVEGAFNSGLAAAQALE